MRIRRCSISLPSLTLRSPPAISTTPPSSFSSEEAMDRNNGHGSLIRGVDVANPQVLEDSDIRRDHPGQLPVASRTTGSCKVGVGETKSTEEIDLILGSQNFDGSDVGHEIGHEIRSLEHSLE